MTFAPGKIKEVRVFLKGEDADLDDFEVGIVGGPAHIRTGTSYHLGKDQLIMSKNPYSARTARDKAGLSNAASAIDIDDDLDELRELSVWLVEQCRANTRDTRDIREIIYSPDGKTVYRWDRQRGVTSAPVAGDGDLSHLSHTHISWYRDSEDNDKVGVFKRFYEGGNDMATTAGDWTGPWIAQRLSEMADPIVIPAHAELGYPGYEAPNELARELRAIRAAQTAPAPVDIAALAEALAPLLPTADQVADVIAARMAQ